MSGQVTLEIRGVHITFPFEPYDIQKDYMSKVIECLQTDQHGVLESPTGTGKTLSLLCASLGWLTAKKAQMQAQYCMPNVKEKGFFSDLNMDGCAGGGLNHCDDDAEFGSRDSFVRSSPKIIYSSRTHTQLSQAMQELKRTAYSNMRATILGGREQLCVHADVMKEPNNSVKNALCSAKVKGRTCNFYTRVEKVRNDPKGPLHNILDIEELVALGTKHKFCPFYMAKEVQKECDIIFMPYNYILDAKIRKSLGISLSNSIVILDEAHNIERTCEESTSMQINRTQIAVAIEDVTAVMKIVDGDSEQMETMGFDRNGAMDFQLEELIALKESLLNFEKAVDAIPLKNPLEGTTFPGTYIFDVLAQAQITFDTFSHYVKLMDRIIQLLATGDGFLRKGVGLSLIMDLLSLVFSDSTAAYLQKIKKCYKVHVVDTNPPQNKRRTTWLSVDKKESDRLLSVWCFNPGFGMNLLMQNNIKSLILTSGTLAPLQPLINELDVRADVRLENPHIVKSDQICVRIVTHGCDKTELRCDFQNRDNIVYINSLGQSLLNYLRLIPGGVLVFFPSYPVLRKNLDTWMSTGLFGKMSAIKALYEEERDKFKFNGVMKSYYESVKDPKGKGAVLFGVCRGKVSEGLDFADANGRAVITIGLPYPPVKDPKVVLKKQYMDVGHSINKEYLNGRDWYQLEAVRAINQAVGRVIRHRYDYAVIILLDVRYNDNNVKNRLSLWLRNQIKTEHNFGAVVRDISQFFKNAQANNDKKAEPVIKEKPSCGLGEILTERYEQLVMQSSSASSDDSAVVKIHDTIEQKRKRRKILAKPDINKVSISNENANASDVKEYTAMVKRCLGKTDYDKFLDSVRKYSTGDTIETLMESLENIFKDKFRLRYLLHGMLTYIKETDKVKYEDFTQKMTC